MDGDDVSTHQLSRADLYDRVWTTPMRTLAAEFGVSDVGLSKLCHRYEVPTPPRGYWVQKQHGKDDPRPCLPRADTAASETVVIEASPRKHADPTPDSPPFEVVVSERLVRPHPLVERTISALRAGRPDTDGRVTSRGTTGLPVTVAPASIRRAGRILDALVKALEARGHQLDVKRLQYHLKMVVVVSKEEIEITLSEKLRQERRDAIASDPLAYREYRLFPTGRLCLQIENHWLGTRTQWVDGRRQRVENCLGAFILQLEALALRLKERRAQHEEEERRRQAWEKERAEKLRLIQEEEARIKSLHEEVSAWHRSERLRAYVDAVRAAAIAKRGKVQPGSELDRWLRWASEQADRIDPLKESPPSILDEKEEYASPYYPARLTGS